MYLPLRYHPNAHLTTAGASLDPQQPAVCLLTLLLLVLQGSLSSYPAFMSPSCGIRQLLIVPFLYLGGVASLVFSSHLCDSPS